ncbi:formate dehydrogenase subunit gamma [Chloroflexota bacterium]
MAEITKVFVSDKGEEKIIRFDIHQIIQHAILMVSFTLLVITGFPMKFHTHPFSQWWVGILGGIEAVRSVHHFAAWLMIILCLYHLVYITYSTLLLKRPHPIKMTPSIQDFVHLLQELQYFTGLSKEKPKFDRFNWREKFEYWAIVWGIVVMAGSGFILMYPVLATTAMPGWIIPTALVVHGYEAMIALSWITLVHIFFSHFAPGIFPLDTSIFTGKVPKERYHRDHPLEYKRLMETNIETNNGEEAK